MNFHHAAMAKGKGKGKEKGKSKLRGQHALVCWTCEKSRHVASQCPSGRVGALDENLFGEVEDPGDQAWFEEDWTSGDWSDGLVAAVHASDTWDDDWWWSTWDEGWSDAWTDTSWSVVPAPVEKATSLAAPVAPEPKATSGAAVSAVTLEPVPSSKAKAKATSKAPAWHLLQSHLEACLLALLLAWFLHHATMCHLVACLKVLHPKTLEDWGLGNLDTRCFDPYLAEHELVVASVDHPQDETWILFDSGAAANCCPPDFAPEFPLCDLTRERRHLRAFLARL